MNKATVYIILLSACRVVTGDEPPLTPESYIQCSQSKKYCVKVNPNSGTIAYKASNIGAEKNALWSVPGWYSNVYLSNDGVTLVTGYEGHNLIPLNYKKDLVMLRIWKSGDLKYKVRLNYLIGNFASLQRTVSHYYWGDFLGFDEFNNFMVSTVENKQWLINMKTGRAK